MVYFVIYVFAHVLLQASACPEPITTVHIQHHDGPIYVSPERLPCDNQLTVGNHASSGNQAASSNQPNPDETPLHHNANYPYHVCETDCKCVTKQLSTCVPINTVQQNTRTPTTYYCCPDYCSYGYGHYPESHGKYPESHGQYPESHGQYPESHGQYPDRHGSGGCPIASEGLIPLLKSYIEQTKCPKHGCQCGHSFSI